MSMLMPLQAERQLQAIEAAFVPHMDKNGHRDVMRKYQQMLSRDEKPERATLEGLAAHGITVETVTTESLAAGAGTSQDETEAAA